MKVIPVLFVIGAFAVGLSFCNQDPISSATSSEIVKKVVPDEFGKALVYYGYIESAAGISLMKACTIAKRAQDKLVIKSQSKPGVDEKLTKELGKWIDLRKSYCEPKT